MTVSVLWLFLTVRWAGIQYVIVVFPDHIHLFCFLSILKKFIRRIIFARIMSGPSALSGFVFLSSFRIPSQLIALSDICGYGCPPECRMFVSSSCVNVDSYCLLSMFGLSSGSAPRN